MSVAKATSLRTSPNIEDNEETDSELKRLEGDCFSELKTSISNKFPEIRSVYSAIPYEAYREIAKKLPDTFDKLLEIDQMTESRVQKYGAALIEVCKEFIEMRMNYLRDKQTAEAMAREDEFEATSDPSPGSSYSSSSGWIGKTT